MTDGSLDVIAFPNPGNDFIAIQVGNLLTESLNVDVYDMTGKLMQSSKINQGSTISYIDARTFYAGDYLVRIYNNQSATTRKITIMK